MNNAEDRDWSGVFVPLCTDRLLLEPVTVRDGGAIYALYSNTEVCRYFDLLPFSNLEQATAHVLRWLDFTARGLAFRYVIRLGAEPIGTLGLYGIAWHQLRASVGFDLLPQFGNRGYMTEAVSSLLRFAHEDLGLHRIQAHVLPENGASRRVLEKTGFVREGVLVGYEQWPGRGAVDLLSLAHVKG